MSIKYSWKHRDLYIPLCIHFEVDMLTSSSSSDESTIDEGAFHLQPVVVEVVLVVVVHIAA